MSRGQFLVVLGSAPAWLWLLHASLLRAIRALGRPASAQGSAFASLALGAPLCATACAPFLRQLQGQAFAAALAYAAVVYACLAYFYFHLFNLGETSRRLRILMVLYQRGEVSSAQLERLYPPLSQIDVRLERLVAMGQIEERGGRYRLKSRLLWLVGVCVEAWRGFLGFV